MDRDKVIVRVKGGLGNQLFGYAAGRRLALANHAELVIDDVTGFLRDHQYRRKFELDKFAIPARKATSGERMEPFERYRRGLQKFVNRRKNFDQRSYIEQEGLDFDSRLLGFRPKGTVYMDGYWQSENYFKDVAETIRHDLQISPPMDQANQGMAERMQSCNAVSIHVRWFSDPQSHHNTPENNLEYNYYVRAIDRIQGKISAPHFFLFSDDPISSIKMLALPESLITCVDLNHQDGKAYLDFWLMSNCKHFIIANSTFSWWGAWLAESESTIVIAPSNQMTGISAWGFRGLLPERWLTC